MLVQNQYIKIIDFGMAKHFEIGDSIVLDHGMIANTVVGTVRYFLFIKYKLIYKILFFSRLI